MRTFQNKLDKYRWRKQLDRPHPGVVSELIVLLAPFQLKHSKKKEEEEEGGKGHWYNFPTKRPETLIPHSNIHHKTHRKYGDKT